MALPEPTPIAVHRCRFVDYVPSAITALAFPPLPLPSIKGKNKSTSANLQKALKFGTLAIGRANGNVELAEWTGTDPASPAPQAWVVTKTLSGPFPSKVDALAFTIRFPEQLKPGDVPSLSDLRLFSTGGGSELVEWDLENGCVKRTLNSQGGSIWSIAPNPSSNTLALGCEDGSVRLVSIGDDELLHKRKFDRVKSRLLSIAWGPPTPRQIKTDKMEDSSDDDEDEEDWIDSWLVTGCSDSSLRKWDLGTGRVVQKMSTDKVRGERTLVWTVGVLGDGTIISGDSLGIVKFWDSRTCTQLHSFQAHGADVLCLAVSPEGSTVYTSGVDQKIIQFTYIKTSSTAILSPDRWVQSSSRRIHSHDVRSLVMWPPYIPLPPSHKRQFPLNIAPILASGGLDMSVVLTPAATSASTTMTKIVNPLGTSAVSTFEDSYHRKIGYATGFAGVGKITVAKQARLLLSAQDESVSLWKIAERKKDHVSEEETEEEEVGAGWEKVLEMDLNMHTNIVACDISDNGKWISIADWYETKLFYLEKTTSGEIRPKRIRDFSSAFQLPNATKPASTGASTLKFSPDSKKLVVGTAVSSFVSIFDLGSESDEGGPKPRLIRTFDHHRTRNVVLGDRIISGGPIKAIGDDEDEDMEVTSDIEDAPAFPLPAASLNTVITRLTMSHDEQWLVTADDTRRVHVFNMDAMQHHTVLPTFPHPIQALSFDPSSPSTLVVGLANNTIHIYDVEARTFPAWGAEVCANVPKRFTHIHDPILGLTFDAGEGSKRRALFWGSTWMCSVKLDAPVGWGGFSKKRRRKSIEGASSLAPSFSTPTAKQQVDISSGDPRQPQQPQNFTMVTNYRPILLAEFLSVGGELVVVERPLVDVLAKLPPSYFKPKYGAS